MSLNAGIIINDGNATKKYPALTMVGGSGISSAQTTGRINRQITLINPSILLSTSALIQRVVRPAHCPGETAHLSS